MPGEVKVAVVTPGYPPLTGGIEKLVEATSTALVELGVEIDVIAQQRGLRVPTTSVEDGVTVRRFGATTSRDFPISVSLARFMRNHSSAYDAIHVHNYHALPAATSLLVPHELPVVLSAHFHGAGNTRLAQLAHRPYALIGRRLMSRATVIVAVSAAERDLLERHFPDAAAKIRVIHNGVDTAELAAATAWPDEPPTVLVLGRLEPYKNVQQVIDAVGRLDTTAQLVVIGSGSDRDRLEVLARHSGQPVRFLGAVSDSDVRRWLRTARVVVSMSSREAFGVAALEAAAAGATAIVSDIEAHREVAGLAPPGRIRLVAIGASAALVTAIDGALVTPNAGPFAVRSWDDVAADYLGVYQGAVSP